MELVLITGLSGSGKSVALNALEDAGYYCVDNLPVKLLPELVAFLARAGYSRVALSMDVRSGEALDALPQHLQSLRGAGTDVKILFLDAKDDTLIQRFSETRRRHPLGDGRRTLPEAIALERELLEDIAALSHHVDTSELRPNVLRSWVREFVQVPAAGLTLLFQSFAYKHGIPLDTDMVFDVRCLPNPHYDPQLRPYTGIDRPVVEFCTADPGVQKMLQDIKRFVAEWLPCFDRDSRSYLTVAIGCTGGRHRSVYLAEALASYFRERHARVLLRHRELPST
ncbi:MAG TPA: RNase adapter RapZ [Burkholderiales bacterium]|nr:RNase adapter RapZ [Burkholderiales bacterium]